MRKDLTVRLLTVGVTLVILGLALSVGSLLTSVTLYLEMGAVVFAVGLVVIITVARLRP